MFFSLTDSETNMFCLLRVTVQLLNVHNRLVTQHLILYLILIMTELYNFFLTGETDACNLHVTLEFFSLVISKVKFEHPSLRRKPFVSHHY